MRIYPKQNIGIIELPNWKLYTWQKVIEPYINILKIITKSTVTTQLLCSSKYSKYFKDKDRKYYGLEFAASSFESKLKLIKINNYNSGFFITPMNLQEYENCKQEFL